MKKLFTLYLALTICATMVACDSENSFEEDEDHNADAIITTTNNTTKENEKGEDINKPDNSINIQCEHNYEEIVNKPATCTKMGNATYTCTECFDSYTIDLPLTHNISNNTCTICQKEASIDLDFLLADDGKSYSVVGFGECEDEDIIIPDQYNNLPVTQIGPLDYSSEYQLHSITLPDSVTTLSDNAFFGCENLKSIVIPNSVTTIGNKAFYRCYKLPCIIIPNGVTTIGDEAFYSCNALKSIIISESVVDIGNDAFSYCIQLNCMIVSPKNPQYKCIDKSVLFNKNGSILVKCVETYTLEQYIIPNGVTHINNSAFLNCNMKNIIIPNSVTSINDKAFYGCSYLDNITIPESVTEIGNSVFEGCSDLKEINVTTNNRNYKSIDGTLYTKDGTILILHPKQNPHTSLIIPDGVKTIVSNAFRGCVNLKNVTIPSSTTDIGDTAFVSSGVQNVVIMGNITQIRDETFQYCFLLQSITIPNSITEIGSYAFEECHILENITYAGTTTQWKNINLWWGWNSSCPTITVHCTDGSLNY